MCLGSHVFVSGRARIQIQNLLVPRSIFFLFILKARQKRTKHKDELEERTRSDAKNAGCCQLSPCQSAPLLGRSLVHGVGAAEAV